MTKNTARWAISALTLIGIVASLVAYWPNAQAIGVAVMAVLLVMMVGIYLAEKTFGRTDQ